MPVSLNPIKVCICFLEQETLPTLLSTGLVPGRDSSMIYYLYKQNGLFHNQTTCIINWYKK